MLGLRKTLTTVCDIFTKNGIKHALIGGFALAAHGINRATVDIDFLAEGTRQGDITRLLTSEGYILKHSSADVLQFAGEGFVDVLLANRPLSRQMLDRAVLEKNLSVYVLTPEDLIGLKIQAYVNDAAREHQDKADIQNLISKFPHLNWVLVKQYADLFNQWSEIERLKG